jgi:hypothetical protein
MKAVDIVAEFANDYLFVEIKDFDDPQICNVLFSSSEEEDEARKKHFKWLKNYLKYKYRDTFLCRHAEQKVDKSIHYVCLLVNFDNALNTRVKNALHPELPVGKNSRRWLGEIARSCNVVNLEKWNQNFPRWPVQRLTSSVNTDTQVSQETTSPLSVAGTVIANNDVEPATIAVFESAEAIVDN